tara:strand:- start:12742 stop:12954 length:213 start_codon:yes stop_codon:yes gene_type:complete
MKAKSIGHAEWSILQHIVSNIDLQMLRDELAIDAHSTKRFDQAAKNLLDRMDAMMEVRRKHLPKDHPEVV